MKSALRFTKASGSARRKAFEITNHCGRYAPRLVARRRKQRQEGLTYER